MLEARVTGYAERPDPYFVEREWRKVNISESTRKCVAFIGVREKGAFVPKATAFFASYVQDQHQFDHLITAEHVISALQTQGYEDILLRVNLVDGESAELAIPCRAFRFHPNEMERTDVAVAPIHVEWASETTGKTIRLDVRMFPLNGEQSFAPTEAFEKQSMGLGKEIVIVGLFRSHYGKKGRNIPIVRVGNIAAKPEEPVWTEYAGYIEAYLVEARSIAGLSGSPVLVMQDYAIVLANRLKDRNAEPKVALLGLMHGHFDIRNLNDVIVEDNKASVHTGIGVVVPFKKILETVEHPDLMADRKEIAAKLRSEGGATADIALDAAPRSSDENPTHREDFTSLLGAAAKTPPQGD